jgi:hypothetical protein
MKLSIALMIALFCTSLSGVAQMHQLSGQGDVVKQEIQLETLKGVMLGFSGDVILTQGSPQKIVMEGQQNILDNIKREVRDGVWNITFDKSVKDAKPVRVYITLATINEVGLSGSGKLTTTNTFQNLDDLDIGLSGSGEIDLHVNADEIETAISGSGDILLEGSAESLEVAISGSGNVNAVALRTADCEIAISGSGDATVFCTASLESAISGSGDVRYKGNVPNVKASISGSGDVSEIK